MARNNRFDDHLYNVHFSFRLGEINSCVWVGLITRRFFLIIRMFYVALQLTNGYNASMRSPEIDAGTIMY